MTPNQTVKNLVKMAGSSCSDAEINAALNRNMANHVLLLLNPVPMYTESGIEYKKYRAPIEHKDWGTDAVLQNGSHVVLTPQTAILEIGMWEFTNDTPPPVYVTGSTYDVYACAAMLLESKAVELAKDLTGFSGVQGSYTYQTKAEQYKSMAASYRALAWIATTDMVRTDLNVA